MVGYGCYSNDDDGVGDGVANDDYHFVDVVDVLMIVTAMLMLIAGVIILIMLSIC